MHRLVVLSGGPKKAALLLTDASISLGRDEDNAIQVDDSSVWHHHAVFQRNCDGYILRNLGARNSTFVNDHPTQEVRLKPGDRVRCGCVEFRYEPVPQSESPDAGLVPGLTQQNALLLAEVATARQQLAEHQRQSQEQEATTRQQLSLTETERRRLATELATAREALAGDAEAARGKAPTRRQLTANERGLKRWQSAVADTGHRARQVIDGCSRLLAGRKISAGDYRTRVTQLARSAKKLVAAQRRLVTKHAPTPQAVPIKLNPKTRLAKVSADRDRLAAKLEQMRQAAASAQMDAESLQRELAEARVQTNKCEELESRVMGLLRENGELAEKLRKVNEDLARARLCFAKDTALEFKQLRRDLAARHTDKPPRNGSSGWHRYLLPFGKRPGHTSRASLPQD